MIKRACRMLSFCALLSLFLAGKTYSCTILCFARDSVVLGGSNEDWKDPLTRMWIYPPAGSSHGWIKFGFAGGFPQGGMNDQGVFWDATAGTHREMPRSEACKTLYSGVLMEKVILECGSVEDAVRIFEAFYSEDQYRAQYLVGDAHGNSVVSDGDSIVLKTGEFQVLTNFHLSEPALGGYPCWRYDKAIELCSGCESLTPYFMGTVLASTHQEGGYPTRYSNIYDLKNRQVYLFHFHNYEEFLMIDLLEEMGAGIHSWDIPSLFSQVKVLGPDTGETLPGNSAVVSWTGLPDSEYTLLYSTREDLSDPVRIEGCPNPAPPVNRASGLVLLPLAAIILMLFRNRGQPWMVPLLVVLMLAGICCEKEDNTGAAAATEHHATLTNLESNTRYYWKIDARTSMGGHFSTETVVRSFRTGEAGNAITRHK